MLLFYELIDVRDTRSLIVLITVVGISKSPAQHFFPLCVFVMSLSRFLKNGKVEFRDSVNKKQY